MLARIGYHGTTKAIKAKLLSRQEALKPSSNEYDWLGSGFYLWEGDAKRALEFAMARIKWASSNQQYNSQFYEAEPDIIGIAYLEGKCLNLSQRTHAEILDKAFNLVKLDETKILPINGEGSKY